MILWRAQLKKSKRDFEVAKSKSGFKFDWEAVAWPLTYCSLVFTKVIFVWYSNISKHFKCDLKNLNKYVGMQILFSSTEYKNFQWNSSSTSDYLWRINHFILTELHWLLIQKIISRVTNPLNCWVWTNRIMFLLNYLVSFLQQLRFSYVIKMLLNQLFEPLLVFQWTSKNNSPCCWKIKQCSPLKLDFMRLFLTQLLSFKLITYCSVWMPFV